MKLSSFVILYIFLYVFKYSEGVQDIEKAVHSTKSELKGMPLIFRKAQIIALRY